MNVVLALHIFGIAGKFAVEIRYVSVRLKCLV